MSRQTRILFVAVAVLPAAAWVAARAHQVARFTENFDQEVKGWRYSCEKEFAEEGSGRALRVSGGGHAVWQSAGDVKDFTLKFKYRYAEKKGTGDIAVRASGKFPDVVMYAVRLEPGRVVLTRRIGTKDGVKETELKGGEVELKPDTWIDITIQSGANKIEVLVGTETVVSFTDTDALDAGVVGLGVIKDSGFVDYDDAELTVGSSGTTGP